MSQCHARSAQPPYSRCEQDAGHDGDHSISLSWSDEECFDPASIIVAVGGPVLPPATWRGGSITDDHGDIHVLNADIGRLDAALEEIDDGMCFSCGCSEQDHQGGACERHDCRAFVP